eukprot:4626205-Prymnesium_polylepis.1
MVALPVKGGISGVDDVCRPRHPPQSRVTGPQRGSARAAWRGLNARLFGAEVHAGRGTNEAGRPCGCRPRAARAGDR